MLTESTLPAPIGESVPHRRTWRLLHGRGRYVGDVKIPGMLHAAFVRSPHGHARIDAIDTTAAKVLPGVAAVFTGADIATVCKPWRGVHGLFPSLNAPLQHALAIDTARFAGEPVALVVATSRAVAEDAAALITIDWTPLPAVADPQAARDGADVIHPDLGTNVCLVQSQASGDVFAAFAGAAVVAEETFRFGRHTGVPIEARGLVAEFDPTERRLTVHHSHQCPHQMQNDFAVLLGLAEHRVRVIAPDIGGGFGIKQQLYGDEIAVCAAAMLLGRPVAWTADRLESFTADIHAREHVVHGRVALSAEGDILAFDVDDLHAIGPYSQFPRSSAGEGRAVVAQTGAPYKFDAIRARATAVFQNKGMSGHYRGVGQPIACAVTEVLIDHAARKAGLEPIAVRRRNLVRAADLPYAAPTGVTYARLAFEECFATLDAHLDIAALQVECAEARAKGRLRGVGLACFVEMTARGSGFYGGGGVAVSSRDGCTLRLEPTGGIRALSCITEQGQGAETGVLQVIAAAVGVPLDAVEMITGDTATSFHGGGTWGSRCMAIGGEAAWRAGRALRAEILDIAARLLQADAAALDIRDGAVVEAASGAVRFTLAEIGAIGHFRPHEVPGAQPQLVASASYGSEAPFRPGCGLQLAVVEIDPATGAVRLERFVVVHECGLVVNPLLVDEQIRGGVVQGLGAALFEELLYDADGQLLNGSLADYLVPTAPELCDIALLHAHGPALGPDDLGIAGVGEAGTTGASAAVLCAVNDALSGRGVTLVQIPCTPERILTALGVI
ncbi:xanthine dehydrogenase family protein molybdopterin-binding subunit [Rhodoplanes sp. SY1]|uniref:xanthine dehydrogenase family protein molybdopterin-binding subunit n=1 Tax=Rhodoplanes sp. SY1 TaxID=3166646 RepID=UPI0038B45429